MRRTADGIKLGQWVWLPWYQRGLTFRGIEHAPVHRGSRLGLPGLEARSFRLLSPPCHLSPHQAGPDCSSDKSLVITAKKSNWSQPTLPFLSQDMERVPQPSQGGTNTPLKSLLWQQPRPITTKNKQIIKKAKISLVWCLQPVWGFYSTLVIYHDHLSMPVNIIIHHQKKKKSSFKII